MGRLAIILLCALPLQAVAADPSAPHQSAVPRADVPQSAVPQTTAESQPTTAPQAAGQPQSGVPQTAVSGQTDAQPPEEAWPILDEQHDYLANKFVDMVTGIDRFFGDERHFQEGNESVLQLDLTKLSGYGGAKNVVLTGRAKVRLPNTEKRLHLLVESNPDQNVSGEAPQTQATPIQNVNAPGSYGAGLRLEKSVDDLWHFSTDAGLKFQGLNTTPFARARASYAMPFEKWRMKLAETAFWFNSLGVGASSQLDLEHALSEPALFRASSIVTWLHNQQNLDLRQDISVYHTLDERSALQYQASAVGASQPHFHAHEYVFLVLYRYRLHHKWMYFEVSPQLHYPQIMNFKPNPALMMRLEVLFDKPM